MSDEDKNRAPSPSSGPARDVPGQSSRQEEGERGLMPRDQSAGIEQTGVEGPAAVERLPLGGGPDQPPRLVGVRPGFVVVLLVVIIVLTTTVMVLWISRPPATDTSNARPSGAQSATTTAPSSTTSGSVPTGGQPTGTPSAPPISSAKLPAADIGSSLYWYGVVSIKKTGLNFDLKPPQPSPDSNISYANERLVVAGGFLLSPNPTLSQSSEGGYSRCQKALDAAPQAAPYFRGIVGDTSVCLRTPEGRIGLLRWLETGNDSGQREPWVKADVLIWEK